MASLEMSKPRASFELAPVDEKMLVKSVQSFFTMIDECKDEVADFVMMRCAKDSAAFHDALGCARADEVLTIQSRWTAEALEDFGTEVVRLWRVIAKFGPAAGTEMSGRAAEPKHPVPGLLFY
jgi:hypothetical protein